jgi:uncharacterized protein (DUF302 family)
LAFIATWLAAPAAAFADVPGLVALKSAHGVSETVRRLESELKKADAAVLAKVDHAAAAAKIGVKLRPTIVVVFGNPRLGAPLLACSQTAGIDLPQKALVWEDERGQVWLGYNDAQYVADRHGAASCGDAVKKMAAKLRALAEAATSG